MYQLTANSFILRLSDGCQIPPDSRNSDYREYLTWVDSGNTPEPYVPPPPSIPTVVDMAQARLALLQAGLLVSVNAALAAMTGIEGEAARIEWEYRMTVRRDSALVAGLSAALGLDAPTLDQLFLTASAL